MIGQGRQDCQCQGCHRVVRVRVRVVRVRVVRVKGSGLSGSGLSESGSGQDYSLLGVLRMLYRENDQLVILARLRHLNGNLKLAGLGNGIDWWGCAMVPYDTGWIRAMVLIDGGKCHGGARLDRGDGIDLWGHAMGSATLVVSEPWDWFMGHAVRVPDTGWIGRWDWFMGHTIGACDTGWIGELGLIHGGLPWEHTALAGSGQWDWFMALCGTGWNGVMGLIPGGLPRGRAARAGPGRLDWFMGMRHAGERLDRDNGIDWWGCAMGARDTGRIREMGLIHEGTWHWLDQGWCCWFMGARHGAMAG